MLIFLRLQNSRNGHFVAQPANFTSEDVQVIMECVVAPGVAQPANYHSPSSHGSLST